MILFKKIEDLRKWLDIQAKAGNSVGFVPTMGALHAGHISLVQHSKRDNPITVCSIFVNPTQFNDPADLAKYPITIEKDIDKLEEAGCDVIFLPSVKEMYPNGLLNSKHYDLGYLETVLEGKYRLGHFQGVCMVVEILLNIVKPDLLYLGQKDYQQCMVIDRLIRLMDSLKKPQLKICPTLREADGLAMSSRNMRLTGEERIKALTIYRVLSMIRSTIRTGDISGLRSAAEFILKEEGFKVDYIEIADAADLGPVEVWDGKQKLVALVAAYLNEVRLIDNMVL
jgi:pantoate--beta-alanine ligase